MKTKEEKNLAQRLARAMNGNSYTKKYEKTRNGFLMRTYRNMKSRVSGVHWKKAHLYYGLDIMPKNDFYEWSINDNSFNTLFEQWSVNAHDRKLTPSIDRLDTSLGYVNGNVRWITHSENSKLGCESKHRNSKRNIK